MSTALPRALRFDRPDKPRLVHRLDRRQEFLLLAPRAGWAAAGLARAFQSRDARRSTGRGRRRALARRERSRYGLVKAAGRRRAGGRCSSCRRPGSPRPRSAGAPRPTYRSRSGGQPGGADGAGADHRPHPQLRARYGGDRPSGGWRWRVQGNAGENTGEGWGAQLGGGVSRKLHLHARRLEITHPVTGAYASCSPPLPDHMKRTQELFGWRAEDVPDDPFEELA